MGNLRPLYEGNDRIEWAKWVIMCRILGYQPRIEGEVEVALKILTENEAKYETERL